MSIDSQTLIARGAGHRVHYSITVGCVMLAILDQIS